MLTPGAMSGSAITPANSLAQAIENEMIAAGLLDLSEETDDAKEMRRKSFVAIARAVVSHFRAQCDLVFTAGELRATADPGTQVPSTARTLTGKLN